MAIQKLKTKHLDEFFSLQSYAFNDEIIEDRLEKEKKVFKHSIGLGAFSEDSALKSALLIRPYSIYFHGKTIPMGGIGDVASYPEVRGQGNISQLFRESLKLMKEQGFLVSYLLPFSRTFYRKFGYESVFEERKYEIKPSEFTSLDPKNQTISRVQWEEARETLKAIYTENFKNSLGPVYREDWVWEEKSRWIDTLHIALSTNEENEADGYLLYHIESTNSNTFIIDELVALTGKAEKALWQFISSHTAQIKSFKYKTSLTNNIAHLFDEPIMEKTLHSGMMARIINMKDFLKEYPFKKHTNNILWLKVTQDFAEWNNGFYKLEINKESVRINKVKKDRVNKDKLLSADIQTWTQLFMGAQTAKQLHFQEKLIGDPKTIQSLQTELVEKIPELYDSF